MKRTKKDILRIWNVNELCAAEAWEFLSDYKHLFKMTSDEVDRAYDWLQIANDDEINAFVEMIKNCILEITK